MPIPPWPRTRHTHTPALPGAQPRPAAPPPSPPKGASPQNSIVDHAPRLASGRYSLTATVDSDGGPAVTTYPTTLEV